MGLPMTIVSVSMPDAMIRTMRELQKSQGFTGTSELVRAALRLLVADAREKESTKGPVEAVIVVTHSEDRQGPGTRNQHRFDDVVKTHIHQKAGTGPPAGGLLLQR